MNLSLLQNLSPLDQFEVRDLLSVAALGNLHISVTNIGLYLTIGGFVALIYKILTANYNKVVSNNWWISEETIYATVHSIVVSQINSKKGQVYFHFIHALFTFILVNILLGIILYSIVSTSHFIFLFSLSFTVVLGATLLGLRVHGLKFFCLFVTAGCPLALSPLLVLIDTISYLARNVSLGLRLAANVLVNVKQFIYVNPPAPTFCWYPLQSGISCSTLMFAIGSYFIICDIDHDS